MASIDPKVHYSQPEVVDLYRTTAGADGLWPEEETIVTSHLSPEMVLLNAGCGAGRISFGLWELGYRQVLGVDFSRPMVEAARLLASKLEYATSFRVGDLTRLAFDTGMFDGVIWSGNGIADFEDPVRRIAALAELRRITRPGGGLVLSSPDAIAADTLNADLENTRWTVRSITAPTSAQADAKQERNGFPSATRYWLAHAVD